MSVATLPSACRLLWQAAGQPRIKHPDAGEPVATPGAVCAWCGYPADWSVDVNRWGKKTFTGWHTVRIRESERLCAACMWASAGRPPDTMRGWTVLYRADGQVGPNAAKVKPAFHFPHTQITSRNDTDHLVATLLNPPETPWFLGVSTSGQKHVLPYTPVNPGAGRWTVRVEDADLTTTPDQWRTVLGACVRLRAAGFTDEAVTTGVPDGKKLTLAGLAVWRREWPRIARYARSPLAGLALWTITAANMERRVEETA